MLQDNKDVTREYFVNIAAEIFGKNGYRKTTVDDICNAAGKVKSAVYYYFSGKEAIFRAVIDKEVSALKNEILNAMEKTRDPQQKLRIFINIRMQKVRELSNLYKVINGDFFETLDFINEIRSGYDKEELEVVTEILEEGRQNNVFVIADSADVAHTICLAMRSLELPLFIKNINFDLESKIEDLIHLLFYGLLKR